MARLAVLWQCTAGGSAMLSRFFRFLALGGSKGPIVVPAQSGLPAAGNVYAFRTAPYSEFSQPETGRFAAFKVIGSNPSFVTFAVLDGVWDTSPTLSQAKRAAILHEHRLAHTGRSAVFGVNADWWDIAELRHVVLLGRTEVSLTEAGLVAPETGYKLGLRYSTIHAANYAAEGEWRWHNDRSAFSEEVELKRAKEEAERAAREERYRTRLSKLTWDQLLAETPLERWSESPPFPSAEFTSRARNAIHEACNALKALGPKPRKAHVRAVLKACVEWFNEADEREGGVIETEEREDILLALEEMVYVARQRGLVEEVERWRDW